MAARDGQPTSQKVLLNLFCGRRRPEISKTSDAPNVANKFFIKTYMNNFKKILYGASALLLLAGCSDDILTESQGKDPGNGTGNGNDGPGVYVGVNFKMPGMGSTRSYTDGDNSSNNGTEVGTDIENNINEVLLILATPDNGFIGSATVAKGNIVASSNLQEYHATAKFNMTDLEAYYKDDSIDEDKMGMVNVFVIANPVSALSDYLDSLDENSIYGDKEWINVSKKVTVKPDGSTDGAVWSTTTNGGNFLMTNSEIATRNIPKELEAWNNHTTQDKYFDLSGNNESDNINNGRDNVSGKGGAVKVERAAARMDFRDGSPTDTPENTYHVVKTKNDETGKDEFLIDIMLDRMCLVNMNSEFYLFRRVSNNGLPTGAGFEICGPEKPWYTDNNGVLVENLPGNYVVDYFAVDKNKPLDPWSGSPMKDKMNYSFFDENGEYNTDNADYSKSNWYVSRISDVLKGTTDNWENNGVPGTYHVWRYLTENTIPGYQAQKNGISTGVVFKGKMMVGEDLTMTNIPAGEEEKAENRNAYWRNCLIEALSATKAPDNGEAVWLFAFGEDDKELYVTWKNVYEAAIKASFSYTYNAEGHVVADWNRNTSLYKAVFGKQEGKNGTGYTFTYHNTITDKDETYTDTTPIDPESANSTYEAYKATPNETTLAAFREAAVKTNGFKIYEPSVDATDGYGYYCYYFYWNRHNDNGRNGIMGPMEFAVVRNNVYKLAVTDIKKLGHPRISSNDPEPPTPDTDDELGNIYLNVDVEVIPWVVRVNDIVFE